MSLSLGMTLSCGCRDPVDDVSAFSVLATQRRNLLDVSQRVQCTAEICLPAFRVLWIDSGSVLAFTRPDTRSVIIKGNATPIILVR